ncbi:MAG: bifunctional metallophosphatase/5'-nucleotidase [Candidatus Riflebacteria bacterium]|nr:bifunctional metallophosphatase/5'-nucleotidase [Candidatus Riflebacteria bacterium]
MPSSRSGVIGRLFVLASALLLLSAVVFVFYPRSNRRYHLLLLGVSKGRIKPMTAKFPPYRGNRMGGAAYVKKRLDQLVASFSGEPYSILSIGSEISGTADAYFSRGATTIEVLNRLKVDAMLVGNIEFTYGRQRLEELAGLAHFPFLSSNITAMGSDAPPPFLQKDQILSPGNGLKIGVVGLTPPQTPLLTSAGNVAGLRFLPPGRELVDRVKSLRARGVDLVVMLSLYDDERLTETEWAQIVAARPDVLVMVDFEVDPPAPLEKDGIIIKTVSGYNQSKEIDQLDLELPAYGGRIAAWQGRRVPVFCDETAPDSGMEEYLRNHAGELEHLKAERVAEFAADYERQYEQECPIGDLVADAMRDLFQADVALMNSGGIQADVRTGPFTLADLFSVLPFDNQVVAMTLTGQDLLELLSVSASLKRGLLQISGGRYSFANRNTEDFDLKEVTIGNEPLDPARTYRVTTNSFLAEGGDGFWAFKRGKEVQYGPLQREAVRAYLTARSASAPIALATEGRILRE